MRQKKTRCLTEKVENAQKRVQPKALPGITCTAMITHILAEPDWINIPCNQKIPNIIICQKVVNKTEWDKKGKISLENKNENKRCPSRTLFLENRCILFKKYERYMNFSELKYHNKIDSFDINTQQKRIKEILITYFTCIQHFHAQPMQFAIPMFSTNTYVFYRPLQTPYYLKLTWMHQQSSDTFSKYEGYILFASKQTKAQIPGNAFQCEDSSYIDEISVFDITADCPMGEDEKLCYYNTTLDIFNRTCKYICHETNQHFSCSLFLFYMFIFIYVYPLCESM